MRYQIKISRIIVSVFPVLGIAKMVPITYKNASTRNKFSLRSKLSGFAGVKFTEIYEFNNLRVASGCNE